MRVFSFDDGHETIESYKGFDRCLKPAPDTIALVGVGVEIDIYALDSPEFLPELKRFLNDADMGYVLIGIYTLQPPQK